MKKILTFAVATLFAFSANAQLLYKISGKGLKEPSYVVGTHHLVTSSFIDKIPGITDVMANTKQVYGEMVITTMTNPDSVAVLNNKMMLPEGKTIKDVLTAEQYQKLNVFFAQTLGTELENPQFFNVFGKMTPEGISTQLTAVFGMQLMQEQMTQDNQLDGTFQKKAMAENKSVGGLETMAFQASVLLGKPMNRQVEGLMCFVDNFQQQLGLLKQLTDAYLAQDLNKMKEVMDFKFNNSCDSTPEEEDLLLYNRNADWVKKMPAIMKDKSTLFVVGSGHLPGDKGLLTLLTNAGYKVEAVK